MKTRTALPIVLVMALLAACSPPPPKASNLEWRKTSELAPPLEEARQDCKVQTAAETSNMRQGAAAVGGLFVQCMRAAGWTLIDRGAEGSAPAEP